MPIGGGEEDLSSPCPGGGSSVIAWSGTAHIHYQHYYGRLICALKIPQADANLVGCVQAHIKPQWWAYVCLPSIGNTLYHVYRIYVRSKGKIYEQIYVLEE